MSLRQLAGAAALATAMMAGSGEAAVVLDQSTFTANGNGSGEVLSEEIHTSSYNYSLVQSELETVTAGVTGQLDELDLKINQSAGPGAFQVVVFNGGQVPGQAAYDYGPAVYTADLTAAPGAPQLFEINLASANFDVAAGQVFSFSIRPDGDPSVYDDVDYQSTATPYAGGRNYISGNSGLPYTYYSYRGTAQFQTYVDTGPHAAAAPEPASWALMIIGLGAVGGTMRRRRRIDAVNVAVSA